MHDRGTTKQQKKNTEHQTEKKKAGVSREQTKKLKRLRTQMLTRATHQIYTKPNTGQMRRAKMFNRAIHQRYTKPNTGKMRKAKSQISSKTIYQASIRLVYHMPTKQRQGGTDSPTTIGG